MKIEVLGPELQCLLRVKDDLSIDISTCYTRYELQCLLRVKDDLSIDISTCYTRYLIHCQGRCSTYGQRYHYDL